MIKSSRSPITIEALQVLDAIDRNGSFAAAAAELDKVPSALSYTVQKLEQELGIPVFDRSGHRAVLTPAGQLLLEQGRHILQETALLADAARARATGWEPVLRLAVDSLFPLTLLFPLVDEFHQAQRSVALQLSEELNAGSWDALLHQRADLVIGAQDPNATYQGLQTRWIGEIDFILVAAPQHPICQLKQPLSAQQVHSFVVISSADSSRSQPPQDRGMQVIQRTLQTPSLAHQIAAHCAGLGAGFVPRFRVRSLLDSGALMELSVQHPHPASSAYIAWRKDADGRALHWFLDKLEPPELLQSLLLKGL